MVKYLKSNLKFLRTESGYTLQGLSDEIDNVGLQALSSYEERGVNPKIDTLIALVDFYNRATNKELNLDNIVRKDLRNEGFVVDKEKLPLRKTNENKTGGDGMHLTKSELMKMIDTINGLTQLALKNESIKL